MVSRVATRVENAPIGTK
ncbi:unnamed protein product, partial [Rotaria sp. Silwood2]